MRAHLEVKDEAGRAVKRLETVAPARGQHQLAIDLAPGRYTFAATYQNDGETAGARSVTRLSVTVGACGPGLATNVVFRVVGMRGAGVQNNGAVETCP